MITSHSLSVETLGRITVLQSMVILLPNKISMLDFVCQGLKDITGVKSVVYRLFDRSAPSPTNSVQSAETVRIFPIRYSSVTYAELNFEIAESEAFDPYIPFLQNFVNMLGVVFEGQNQRKLNETLLEKLEQRVAERTSELQKREEDLRITLNSIGDAVISTDIYGNVTNMNPVAEKLTGWKKNDGIGRQLTDVFQIVNVDTMESALNPVERVLATGEIVGLANHTSLIAKDGTHYQIADSAAPIRDINGIICGVVLVFRDVTDEYRVAEALKSSEEKYRGIVEKTGDLVTSVDENGRFTYVNHCAEKIFGLPVAQCLGKSAFEYIHPEDRDKTLKWFSDCVGNHLEQSSFENRLTNQVTQDIFHLLWTSSFHYDDKGRLLWVNSLAHDITERKQAEMVLRESERAKLELLEILNESQHIAKTGSWVWDLKTNHIWWSDETYRIFGVTPQEFVPSFEENGKFIHPDDLMKYSKSFEHSLQTGELLDVELRLVVNNGSLKYCQAKGRVKYDNLGLPSQFIGTLLDITEQKRSEESLRYSEERLRLVLDVMHIGVWDWDLKNDTWYVTPIYHTMLGYEPTSGLGDRKKWIERVHPEDREMVSLKIQAVLRGETANYQYEARMRHADGTYRWHRVIGQPIEWDKENKLTRLIGVRMDITDRKQAEIELRGNETRFRALVDTIPDLIWLKDADGVYLSCNQIFERLFGAKEADIVGKTDYDFVNRELADFFRDHDRKAIAAGKPIRNEEWVTYADDGHSVLLETIKTPMFNESGLLIGVLGIGRDITERKRAEEEKIQLEGQLQQAQKLEAVGQLAGGVAHDFNNMLGVILGHAEMAMEDVEPSQPVYGDLEEIHKAATRSTDITRQLLAFARKQTISPKVIDLNETIEGMLKMLRRLIGENIDLAWLPGAGLWAVKIDPSQVDQILANLFVNARDAIAGVGKITVETGNNTFDEEYCDAHAGFIPGEYSRIVVSDTGSGMDRETLLHIFEPFFTTKGVGEGTGLGLATVYGAVRQNDGFINVYSETGRGTTFTIYLPRYVGQSWQVRDENAMNPDLRGNETILLVEDEPTILGMTVRMLERLGYTVLASGSPNDAIRHATAFSGEINMLMTDVVMPGMNGRDLASRLLGDYPKMKCLFMSGYTANIITNHGVLDEGMDFIQKPFSKKDLAAKVRQVLES